jgi:uracil-DNA glycosylase family 4
VSTDVYISNIVKCAPPNNRKPTDTEIDTCIDYLFDQLDVVNPKVIVALGNTAISGLTKTIFGITKLRGKFMKFRDRFAKETNIFVMPTWHPSYVLRHGSAGQIYEDFKNDLQLAIIKSKEQTNE